MQLFQSGIALLFSNTWAWIAIPIMIFFARILDVSVGTVRVILLSKGNKVAVFLGFIESLVWILVISQIMQNLSNPISYLAWAAGYSAGTYAGILLEARLAIGTMLVRVITSNEADTLVLRLNTSGYGVTTVNAHGSKGQVKLIYTIVQRRHLEDVLRTIQDINPNAFISVEAVQSANMGVFPRTMSSKVLPFSRLRQRQKQKRK